MMVTEPQIKRLASDSRMCLLVPEFGYSAGTETVLLKVLPRLVAIGHTVVLAAPRFRLKVYAARGLDGRVQRFVLEWPAQGWRKIPRLLARRLDGRFQLAADFLRRWQMRDMVALTGASHVFVPWVVGETALDFGRPTGVMVMDLAWRHYPSDWFSWSPAALDAALKSWIDRASLAFPVSEATRMELLDTFGNSAAKLITVPHGAELKLPPITGVVAETATPYFLMPATITPNKDHATLIEAALVLWREGREFRLVLSGGSTASLLATRSHDRGDVERLRRLCVENASIIQGRLEARGFVSDEELEGFYTGCLRVVLTSTYEGFGLPLLEAFERGLRVICTDIAPFREQIETYGMAGRTDLVRIGDVSGVAHHMRRALNEEQSDNEIESLALKRQLEKWTWDDAARVYAEAFMEISTKGRPDHSL